MYTASSKRQTFLQNDRIYGIMQVDNNFFGLKPSFSALQDAFGVLMNSQNPVLAQLHMHDEPPAIGKSWRVSEELNLPLIFMHVLTSQSKCESLSSPRGIPFIIGKSCNFAELLSVWSSITHHREEHDRTPYQAHVLLDARVSQASITLDICHSPSRQSSEDFGSR